MSKPETLQLDAAQVRGALRALRELRDGPDPERTQAAVAGDPLQPEAPWSRASKPWKFRRWMGVIAFLSSFGALACLALLDGRFSGGRGASMFGPVVSSRPLAGGSIQKSSGPVGPEQQIVQRSFLSALPLAAVMATSGMALAQDATFMSSDTISVQGWTNTPNEITIECRIWMPARGGGGAVYTEQRNSLTDKHLNIFPTSIDSALVGVTPFGNDPIFPCTMPPGAWSHVALVRKGTQVKAFLNGQLIGTSTCAAGAIDLTSSPDLRIGAAVHNDAGSPLSGFVGRIDWLRVSSVARYTTNFTVPSEDSLIPADASTELLLRFNEAPGALQVRDDGPHHFASVVGDTNKFPAATAPRFPGPAVCPSDLDGDGEVNGSDISLLLLDFGRCP